MKKNNIITIVSILIACLLIFATILIIHNYNNTKLQSLSEVYGVVKHVNADSIVVEDSATKKEKTYLMEEQIFKEGDLVSIKAKGDKVIESKVIVDNYVSLTTRPIVIVEENTTTTTTERITTTTKTNKNKTTTTQVVNNEDKDQIILKYLENEKLASEQGGNDLTFKEKAKNGFVTIVDFIFYEGTIKGITFKELKNSTKAKVIYYALLIDNGIDSKFPGYKDTLSTKYKDVKGKLVAEFLDIKYEMCSRSEDGCKQASDDLNLLKYSLNLTWDVVKSFFGYVKDLTVPKIKSWYESFRG